MRSLFAKTFLGTLAIYPLSRGLGFLMLYLLDVPPPVVPPRVDILQQVLPFYAQAALDSLAKGQTQALAAFLAAQQQALGLKLHFAPTPHSQCLSTSATVRLVQGMTVAVPIIAADGTEYCLDATFQPLPVEPGPTLFTAALLSLELACCGLVSFSLARYVARPLRNLAAAAVAFAGGDLSARGPEVKAGRHDETAELVRAFNRMAEQIAALIKAQQRFIADVSHEIKSPLARFSLAAALARRCAAPRAEAHFDRLEHEIEIASSLVRELQVLSSLQGAGTLSQREMMDLAAVLIAAIDNVAFEWEGRTDAIRLAAPSAAVMALGDPAVLQRAVENLLRNALFYAPEDSVVEVTLTAQEGEAHIEVRDHGPGVPEASLEYLFEPFFRVDSSRTRNTGGVGIGLAIFARAVVLHGGRACATNAEPSGLRISIDLPLAGAIVP